jgi:hypothetical protein
MDACSETASETTIGMSTWQSAMEHRWGQRVRCRLRVRLSIGDGITGGGKLRDVSMSGAFIDTALALPLCAPVDVVVLHDDSFDREVEMTGCVVRIADGGVGIEWDEPQAGSICAILGCSTRCVSPQNPPCQGERNVD